MSGIDADLRNSGDFWARGLVFCGERKPNQNSCETENHRINDLSAKATGLYLSSGILRAYLLGSLPIVSADLLLFSSVVQPKSFAFFELQHASPHVDLPERGRCGCYAV